mmetsp:Transcript_31577/g.46219  ORF Transcript_31577/g.46219 Transcript_31577/m.46219 type:complete len:88 (-) Transcript_31577:404-667(-)
MFCSMLLDVDAPLAKGFAPNVRYTTSFYDQGDPLAAPGQHLHLKMSHSSELAWMPGSHHSDPSALIPEDKFFNAASLGYTYDPTQLH